MRRERLLPTFTAEQLAEHYQVPHGHRDNTDHLLRVAITIDMAKALGRPGTVADLSCGDAAIALALDVPRHACYLGDMAPAYPIHGPIESTIHQIPQVDLFICTETVEHLDDPDTVLKAVRDKTRTLVLSTPVGCFHDTNPQHYWAWSREAVEAMLAAAGFVVETYVALDFTAAGPFHYVFGIWTCR